MLGQAWVGWPASRHNLAQNSNTISDIFACDKTYMDHLGGHTPPALVVHYCGRHDDYHPVFVLTGIAITLIWSGIVTPTAYLPSILLHGKQTYTSPDYYLRVSSLPSLSSVGQTHTRLEAVDSELRRGELVILRLDFFSFIIKPMLSQLLED